MVHTSWTSTAGKPKQPASDSFRTIESLGTRKGGSTSRGLWVFGIIFVVIVILASLDSEQKPKKRPYDNSPTPQNSNPQISRSSSSGVDNNTQTTPEKIFQAHNSAIIQSNLRKVRLFVEAEPEDSRIRVMNIKPKFYQGMVLKPGRYLVETSKKGYGTQKEWIELHSGENKRLEVRLEQLQVSIQPTTTNIRRLSPTSNIIKRDGIYVAYANGIVMDTNTGLEWKAGPDKNTTWDKARAWVQSLNLDGGRWRMPIAKELKTLYHKGAGSRNRTSLLKASGWGVWSGGFKGSSLARLLNFYAGDSYWCRHDDSNDKRAFAVRSQGDGQ